MPGAVTVTPGFWRDRTVLVTGHTGFKGAWLTLWLQALGARVVGVARGTGGSASLYQLARVPDGIVEDRPDIRDAAAVRAAFARHEPEVVIHLAAQPLVRRALADPLGTFATNIMGTAHVLEAVRATPSVRVVVNVSSDRCYDVATPISRPFVETDALGGRDPYAASKACADLLVRSYERSFFAGRPGAPRLGSARSGNVIGGGDFGADRLLPDIMRAAMERRPVAIRDPEAVRSWQHVLNPVAGYLRLAEALHCDPDLQGGWNFGPAPDDARTVRWIAERLGELWPEEIRWQLDEAAGPRDTHVVSVDSTEARRLLGWSPPWDLREALDRTVAWYLALRDGKDMRAVTLAQIEAFEAAGARA